MPVALSGQNIVSSSGSNTWADVVALGSTNLTSFTGSSGKTLYRWTGDITLSGTAQLTISDQTIHFFGTSSSFPGRIRVAAGSSAKIYFVNCQLIFQLTNYYQSPLDDTVVAPLFVSLAESEAGIVSLVDCMIHMPPTSTMSSSLKRIPLFISSATRTSFAAEFIDTSAPANGTRVFAKDGATVNYCFFKNTEIPYTSSNTTISNSIFVDSNLAPYTQPNRTPAQPRSLSSFNLNTIISSSSAYGVIGISYTAVSHINPVGLDLSIIRVDYLSGYSILEHSKVYTFDFKLVDTSGNVNNAKVLHFGRTNTLKTSNSSGIVATISLVAQETNIKSLSLPSSDYSKYSNPIPLIDYSSYRQKIVSYLHTAIDRTITVNAQLGTTVVPSQIELTIDNGITQTNQSTVQAYTGITCTVAGIVVSQSRSLAQVYDYRKSYWSDSQTVPADAETMLGTTSPTSTFDNGVFVEIGLRFQSNKSGKIRKIRYYKASGETGTHTGRIWTDSGTLLTSVTFSPGADFVGEGWHEQELSTPLSISANTVYVVSVSMRRIAFISGGFNTPINNGNSLTSATGNNGVYSDIAGTFPGTASAVKHKYFVDVEFTGDEVDFLPPQRVGDTADFRSVNLTLSNALAIGGKFDSLQTAGDITIQSGGSITGTTGSFVDARGNVALGYAGNFSTVPFYVGSTSRVSVTSGTTTLTGWVFSSGSTLDNASASSATVYVDASQISNISIASPTTGGGSITLTTDSTILSFTGLPSGTEVRMTQGSVTIDYQGNITTGTYSYSYTSFAGEKVTIYFNNPGYVQQVVTLTLSNSDQSIPLEFDADPSYIP